MYLNSGFRIFKYTYYRPYFHIYDFFFCTNLRVYCGDKNYWFFQMKTSLTVNYLADFFFEHFNVSK